MLEALDIDEGGGVYLPFAQHKMRMLKVVLDGAGLSHGRKVHLTPDGVGRIHLRTRRGRSKIEKLARAKGHAVDIAPSAYAPDDWADEWYDYIRIELCKDRPGFLLMRDNKFGAAPYVSLYVDGTNERVAPWDGTSNPDPVPPLTTRNERFQVVEDLISGNPNERLTASQFSGLMRSVVGCYHASGRNSPFRYSWLKTHGIVRSTTTAPGSGVSTTRHWVVEASPAGVYAAPISAGRSNKCCDGWSVTKYLAEGSSELSLVGAFGAGVDGVTQLLDAAAVSSAYAKAPFYLGHGWAFNYSGTEAQAVTQEHRLTPAKHYSCNRWKLSFTYTPGDDTLRATIAAIEVDKPAAFQNGQVWIPTDARGKWDGIFIADATALATYTSQDAPVHVYYIGDAEAVTRFSLFNDTTGGTEVSPTPEPDVPAAGGGAWGQYLFQPKYIATFTNPPCYNPGHMTELRLLPPSYSHYNDPGLTCGFIGPGFNSVVDNRNHDLSDDTLEIELEASSSQEIVRFDCGPQHDQQFPTGNTWVVREHTNWLPLQTRTRKVGQNIGRGSVVLFASEREAVLSVQSMLFNETTNLKYAKDFLPGFSFYGGLKQRVSAFTQNDCLFCLPPREDIGFTVFPVNFHNPLVDGGTTNNTSNVTLATLSCGVSVDTASAEDVNLSTFLRPGIVGQIQESVSGVFAMHGNLYAPDLSLTPADQSGNRAFWLYEPLQLRGGFVAPVNSVPGVIAFIGKA